MDFQCKGDLCENSCCGAYSGFSDKLLSVDGRLFKDIILTAKDFERLDKPQFEQYIVSGADGLKRMKTDNVGVCAAFQNGKCLINEFKPTICRCYPLYLDEFVGVCSFKECPSVVPGSTLACYRNEIESLLEIYEFWISYYRKRLNEDKLDEH